MIRYALKHLSFELSSQVKYIDQKQNLLKNNDKKSCNPKGVTLGLLWSFKTVGIRTNS